MVELNAISSESATFYIFTLVSFLFRFKHPVSSFQLIFQLKRRKKSVVHVSSETQTCSGNEMRWIHKIVTQWIYYTLQRRSVMLSSASCCFLYWIIALEQALLSFNISFTSHVSLFSVFFRLFHCGGEEKKSQLSRYERALLVFIYKMLDKKTLMIRSAGSCLIALRLSE